MSQIRMHTQIPGSAGSEGSYAVDPPLMGDIQQVRRKFYRILGLTFTSSNVIIMSRKQAKKVQIAHFGTCMLPYIIYCWVA